MVGSNAIRALVVDDDLSLIGEYRRILSAGSERPSESDDLFCALDGELIGAVINHKQFPAVDLYFIQAKHQVSEVTRIGIVVE